MTPEALALSKIKGVTNYNKKYKLHHAQTAEALAKGPEKALSKVDPPPQYTASSAMYAQVWLRSSPLEKLADGATPSGASVALEVPTTSDAGDDYTADWSSENTLDRIMGQSDRHTKQLDKRIFVGEYCPTLDSLTTFVANVGLRQCVTVDPKGQVISLLLECAIDIGDVLSELPVRRFFKKRIKEMPHLPMVIVSFFDRAHVRIAAVVAVQTNVLAVVGQRFEEVPSATYLSIRKEKDELVKDLRSMATGGESLRPTMLWEQSKGKQYLRPRPQTLTSPATYLSFSQQSPGRHGRSTTGGGTQALSRQARRRTCGNSEEEEDHLSVWPHPRH